MVMNLSALQLVSINKFRTKNCSCFCIKMKVVVLCCMFLLRTALLRRQLTEGAYIAENHPPKVNVICCL